ncbi:acetoacetate decarboxylase family protein [Streptomyces sp. NPDC045431]|uniref:acetoacetate decarboxylase family protein n=1 Tax=Streptomyces sp. NPDC045431 TaxID=3155613 RepID=UPI0033D49D01
MTAYPPEPWHLAGQMYLSLWLVPRHALPPDLPPGARPVTVAGRGVAGVAWIVYEQDSVLHYNELLAAVLVRDGARPRVTITDIWVDSPASLAGGRELWGIPKDPASFDLDRPAGGGLRATAKADHGTLATAEFAGARRLPGRWPLTYHVAQTLHGRLKTSPVRTRTGVALASGARWSVPDDSPLSRFTRRAPLLSLVLRDFRLRFGAAS